MLEITNISCKYIVFLQDFVNFKTFLGKESPKTSKRKGAKVVCIVCFIFALKTDTIVAY